MNIWFAFLAELGLYGFWAELVTALLLGWFVFAMLAPFQLLLINVKLNDVLKRFPESGANRESKEVPAPKAGHHPNPLD